jgi:hypothetical protein
MKYIGNSVRAAFLPMAFFICLATTGGTAQAKTLAAGAGDRPQDTAATRVTLHGKARQTGSILVNVYEGKRQLIADHNRVLFRLIDGKNRVVYEHYLDSASVLFEHVPVRGNDADNFRVIVSRRGHDDGGISSVHVTVDEVQVVNLMEIPRKAVFDFSHAHWQNLAADYPEYWRIIAAGASSPEEAETRWESLIERYPNRAACILNLFTAMSQLDLPSGKTMLAYYNQLIWDKTMAQDRFFGWVDPELETQIRLGVAQGIFVTEPGAGILHPGATDAFKQIALDEADLNPTFHDNDRKTIDGVDYEMFEVDIDYYKDPLAHTFGEVIPNMITGGLTDPMKVYQLRWNSGWAADFPEYEPPETIIAADKQHKNARHSDARSWRNLRLLEFWHFARKKH